MGSKVDFVVHNVSVVLLAHSHNPSILNPDFLKLNGIVEKDWDIRETLTTPGLSQTVFTNGITWQVDENRCTVTQAVRESFQNGYLVHELAKRYVKTLPHIPYQAVGINWLFHTPKKNHRRWLKNRFLKPGKWREQNLPMQSVELKFELDAGDGQCFFKLTSGTVQFPEQDKVEAIIVDANYHFQGPFRKIAQISEILDSWRNRQEHLLKIANKYLRSRLV